MNGSDAPYLLYSLLVLMLVVSASLNHRIAWGRTLRMTAAWIAIVAGVYAVALFLPELKLLYQRALDDLSGKSGQVESSASLQLTRAKDGHFWVVAKINAAPLRLLVDSGASVTTLSAATADRLGLPWRNGLPVAVQTANGMVMARRVNINSFRAGPIRIADLPVLVLDMAGGDSINVIGMNLLSRLDRWTVEGEQMTWTASGQDGPPDN